jgi:competence transcription factor ComK
MFIKLTLSSTKTSVWFNIEHIQHFHVFANNTTVVKEVENHEGWQVTETPYEIMELIAQRRNR